MDTEQRRTVAGYEEDFQEWVAAQAAAIRDGRWQDVDVENLAEEIDSLGRSDRRQLASRLMVLTMHLLKQQAQPDRVSRSWRSTVFTQARHIKVIVSESPSLRPKLSRYIADAYADARQRAALETGLPIESFPPEMTDDVRKQLSEALEITLPT